MKCPICKKACLPGVIDRMGSDELVEVCYCPACSYDFYGRVYNVREMSSAEFGIARRNAAKEDHQMIESEAE